MKIIKALILLLVVSFTLGSCKHKPNFSDFPEVSYANDVSPIIIGNCGQEGCHGNVGELDLTTYDKLIHGAEVTAGSPEKSKLYKVITKLSGEDRMPLAPAEPLTNEQIETIFVWIGQGAKNN